MSDHAQASAGGLRDYPAPWALLAILTAPLVFPPVLLFYLGLLHLEQPWALLLLLTFIGGITIYVDRETRGRINENVRRVASALQARRAAAEGQGPSALLLRAFAIDLAYADPGGEFSLFELVDPALRASGYQPIALGRNLPLPPVHGVAILETANDTWWKTFKTAAADAAVIVVWPQDTPSLSRELRWLRDTGRLAKVVLVMAPESLSIVHPVGADGVVTTGPAADNSERAKSWNRVRQFWADILGLSLPRYDPRGALLHVLADGKTVQSHLLRTAPEVPRWFAGQLLRDYSRRYGVNYGAIWREVQAEREWRGPAIADTWRKLSPTPLTIDWRSYLNPPGANGMKWRELTIIAASGWGSVLSVVAIILISWVF